MQKSTNKLLATFARLTLTAFLLTACVPNGNFSEDSTNRLGGSQGDGPGSNNGNLASPVQRLEILPSNPVIGITDTVQLRVTAVAYDGSRQDVTSQVNWNDSDAAVAAQDGSTAGLFRAAAPGVTSVSVVLANHQAATDITVNPAQLVSLQFSPPLGSLPRGASQTESLIGIFSDGSSHDLSDQANWSSSDTGVVTVSNNPGAKGRLAVVNPGNATVTASVLGLTYSQNFTGTNAVLNGLSVQAPAAALPVGLSAQLTVVGSYSDGTSADLTASATWESANPAVASANFGGVAGKYLGLSAGSVLTIARVGSQSANANLTVVPATLVSLEVSPDQAAVPAGTTQAFQAIGHLSDGRTIDLTSQVQWSSDAAAAAPSAQTPGLFRAVSVGLAKAKATYNSLSDEADLNVNAASLVSIQVQMPAGPLAAGRQSQGTVLATYSDGSVVDVSASAAWASTNAGVASVSNALGSKGQVSAVAPGTTTISASYGGQQASFPLTISNAVLTGLAVSGAASSVAKGLQTQLTAVGSYSDGSTADLTGQVSWSSATPSLAAVSNASGSQGQVSALDVGNASLVASFGGQQASYSLTITNPVLAGVSVTSAAGSVAKGLSTQLTALGIFTDGSTVDITNQVSWASSNSAVASVSNANGSQGRVNARALGSATLSATINGQQGSTSVTVTNATLAGITVAGAVNSVVKGAVTQLTATANYTDGSSADLTTQVTWASSNSAVASVSAQGLVNALGVGSSNISATFGSQQGVYPLTITNASLTGIAVTSSAGSVAKGASAQLTATATYSDGSTADATNLVTWSSSNANVATVNSQGAVNAVGVGSATLTASLNGQQASTSVTVTNPTLTALSVSGAAASVAKGLSTQLAAVGTYSDGTTANVTSQVAWTSSNANVATVNNQGVVSARGVGSATLTGSLNGQQATYSVTITNPTLTSIAVTSNAGSLAKGTLAKLTATGTYSDGTTADITSQMTWSSSNAAVATVSGQGVVSTLGVGSATLTGSLNGQQGSVSVTITNPAVASLAVTGNAGSMAKGLTSQLAATATYTDGSTADVTSQVTWASSNAGVATVSGQGLVSARGVGNATVTGSLGGQQASTSLTVTNATLTNLSVASAAGSVAKGLNAQLTATGTYSDGSTADVTSQVAWTSSNASVATVNGQGLVSALGAGTATLTGSLAGKQASTSLTITNATLTGLSVTSAAGSVAKGTGTQLTATGTYSDGSTADVTGQVAWTSSNASVATVSSQGAVSAVGVGSATLTGSLAGQQKSVTVTITNPVLTGITVTSAAASVAKGLTTQLTATGTYSDGSTADLTSQVTWSSNNPALGSVSAQGLVSTLGVGTATFGASFGGFSASKSVTVTAAQVVSVAVSPATLNVIVLALQNLTAIATYTDGTTANVTSSATWTSSNVGLLTVTDTGATKGQIKMLTVGDATVTATLNGKSGTCAVHSVLF